MRWTRLVWLWLLPCLSGCCLCALNQKPVLNPPSPSVDYPHGNLSLVVISPGETVDQVRMMPDPAGDGPFIWLPSGEGVNVPELTAGNLQTKFPTAQRQSKIDHIYWDTDQRIQFVFDDAGKLQRCTLTWSQVPQTQPGVSQHRDGPRLSYPVTPQAAATLLGEPAADHRPPPE